MKRALLVVDFINEIVDPDGQLAAKGYANFVTEHETFRYVNMAIEAFREAGDPVIFVRLAFDPSYTNPPKGSPLFGRAHELGILADGSWSTEINSALRYNSKDEVVVKPRVSAFHDTQLATMLRGRGITDVYIAGVATDLAVEATARSAHDNDFAVWVVGDACAAANADDHEKSLRFLPKIARLVRASSL